MTFDETAAEAFAERMGETINAGAMAVMMSVGHRTGLFATLDGMPASTSAHIAAAAGLAERYVREWLAAMVTGGVVDYDAGRETYTLPPEHAACLTPEGALGNLAVYAQFVAMAGAVQERVLECFKTGGGTRYEDYPCFHTMMREDSAQTVVAQLFDEILPLAPGLGDRLESGIDVLDAGCGSGWALAALASRYPRSRFAGYDLSAEAVSFARAVAAGKGLENLRFEVVDLTTFNEVENYDLVTSFDAIHDQKVPRQVLAAIHGALRPGGLHLMQDIGGSAQLENNIDFPFATFLYTASCMHCMPVSLGQGGEGLGTMWGWETAEAMLNDAGFATVERHVLAHDPMNVWFVSGKRG